MNKPRTRIPLESASKDELIAAIRAECPFGNYIDRMEMHVYRSRGESLLRTMMEAVEEMDRNRQTGTFNPAKRNRWSAAMRKWTKANTALENLQSQCGQPATTNQPPTP